MMTSFQVAPEPHLRSSPFGPRPAQPGFGCQTTLQYYNPHIINGRQRAPNRPGSQGFQFPGSFPPGHLNLGFDDLSGHLSEHRHPSLVLVVN